MEGLGILIALLILGIAIVVYGFIRWSSNGTFGAKPTVLVVDDDVNIRTMLRRMLTEDCDVVEADDGYNGLSRILYGEQAIDLIVTDLKMPGLNGVKFIEKLPEDIPVIVISGFLHLPEFQEALGHLHPAAVFEKPFHLPDLRQAIHRALGFPDVASSN